MAESTKLFQADGSQLTFIGEEPHRYFGSANMLEPWPTAHRSREANTQVRFQRYREGFRKMSYRNSGIFGVNVPPDRAPTAPTAGSELPGTVHTIVGVRGKRSN